MRYLELEEYRRTGNTLLLIPPFFRSHIAEYGYLEWMIPNNPEKPLSVVRAFDTRTGKSKRIRVPKGIRSIVDMYIEKQTISKEDVQLLKQEHYKRCAKAATYLGTLINPGTLAMEEDNKARWGVYPDIAEVVSTFKRRARNSRYRAKQRGITVIEAAARAFDTSRAGAPKRRWRI